MTVNNMNMFFNNPASGNSGGGGSSVPLGGEVQLISSNRSIVNINGAIYAQWGLPVSDESLFDASFWEFGMVRYPFGSVTNGRVLSSTRVCRKPNTNVVIIVSHSTTVNNREGTLVTNDGGVSWTYYLNNYPNSNNVQLTSVLWNPKWDKFVMVLGATSASEVEYIINVSDDGVNWVQIDRRYFSGTNGRVLGAVIDDSGDLVLMSTISSGGDYPVRRYAQPNNSSVGTVIKTDDSGNVASYFTYSSGRYILGRYNGGSIIVTWSGTSTLNNTQWLMGQVLNTTTQGFPGGRIDFTNPIAGGVDYALINRGVRQAGGELVYYYSNDAMQTLTTLTVDTSKFDTYLGFYDGLYYSTGYDGIVYTSPDLTTFTPTTLSSEIGVPILLTDKRVIGAGGFGGKLAGSSTTISSADGFSRYVRIK